MRSCLAWLLKPGHKSKTKATNYSEQVDSNHRTIQERIWVNIFKVFKFSMSKIEINNFKMHYDVLEWNFLMKWKVPYTMKSFLDVNCSQKIPATTGTFKEKTDEESPLKNLLPSTKQEQSFPRFSSWKFSM